MKTLLVVTNENLKKHAGKEVDDYITVKAILMPEEMPAIANEIRNRVRALLIESAREGKPEQAVNVECDVTPPYRVILASLSDTMSKEEGVKMVLPPDFNMTEKKEQVNLV